MSEARVLPRGRSEIIDRKAMVESALREIESNYRDANLSHVADEYNVSLAYVSECVRVETGKTYKELLQKKRMEVAARQLRKTNMNIQQIIANVGYQNTSYFYHLFKQHYGVGPREYRVTPRKPGRIPKKR